MTIAVRRAAAFLLAAVALGCTTAIDLRYRPPYPAAPLTGARDVALFVAPVEDPTGGVRFNDKPVALAYSRPMADGIREALALEARRLGFSVVPAAGRADAVLRAALKSAQVLAPPGDRSMWVTHARILLELKLEARGGRSPLWSDSLEAEAAGVPWNGYDIGKFGPFLNQALAAAMAELGPLLAPVDFSSVKTNRREPKP